MRTFLTLLLLIAVAGLAYYQYNKNTAIETRLVALETKVIANGIGITIPSPAKSTTVTSNWQSMSASDVAAILTKNLPKDDSVPIDTATLQFSQSIDITGDGTDEGVFTEDGGNNQIDFILMKNSGGTITPAQEKEKDGTTHVVALYSLGRATSEMGYKFLTKDHGFYTSSLSYDEKSNAFKCDSTGVNAYAWNSTTKLFEWNQSLTAIYTAQICS